MAQILRIYPETIGNKTSSLRNKQSFLVKSLCETNHFAKNRFFTPEMETDVENNAIRAIYVSPKNESLYHVSGNIDTM